ncbi:IQ domain-containing protein [Quillaja saponaria]|uniref:IQ domain-containing protein n=1 Tax=Quillaja saponaria TaxID=32244 RepID=A0AAD7Q6V3_QUISA|nr:IQ domain-containing protein [Quillaja saponaria]
MDSPLEAVLLRSINFGHGDVKHPLRSVSFNGRDAEPATMRSFGSGKIVFEGSLNFKGRQLETMFSFKTPAADMETNMFGRSVTKKNRDTGDQLISSYSLSETNTKKNRDTGDQLISPNILSETNLQSPLPQNQRDQAALKLQKVYKSFRTRRQLADCAVLVEQRWWKLLDFAELKRSSISFFDIEKPETAISRWARARTRAAKVGKGLSKDRKARKLALQHWLEAIDPRHRYGHNLQFYYVNWLHCESNQPFFYWLDIGDGKEVSLERCPRSKLQQQCIKYLGPTERKAYKAVVENGKFFYKESGKLIDTTEGPKDAKWIFVLSTSKTLYIGLKNKGTFQHSSFLAGGATLSAGRLVLQDGILKSVWPHSGHYLPTEENFQEFMSFLKENNVDLSNVKKSSSEEEDEAVTRNGKEFFFRGKPLEAESSQDNDRKITKTPVQEITDLRNQDSIAAENSQPPLSRLSRGLGSKIARLEIPNRSSMVDSFKKQTLPPSSHCEPPESPTEEDYETADESFLTEEDFMVSKSNLFDEEQEEEDENPIPKEKIMKRIDSHKGMNSYQLAQQLSSRWTTGAGPRIGCMRDYPSQLQFRVLEHANLSPRPKPVNGSSQNLSRFCPNITSPIPLFRETTAIRKSIVSVIQSRTAPS